MHSFHPRHSMSHKMFLSKECRLSDRIHFLNDLVASEEYLETYNRVKQELKDEGVELYQDEAMYLGDLCLGSSITFGGDIKTLYDYIEKLKSIDADFVAFAEKEIILIQATMEVFMRDEIAQAINEEQLITEAEKVADFKDAEELETEEPTIHAMETPSFKDAIMDFMFLKNNDIEEDCDEDKDEDEESDEKDEKDKG